MECEISLEPCVVKYSMNAPLILTSLPKMTAVKSQSRMAASAVLNARSGPMKRPKFSEEQSVYATQPAEAGTRVGDLC
jgi:hypothetical protein